MAQAKSRAAKLTAKQAKDLLDMVPDWSIVRGELTRTFHFNDYHGAMEFVNATAWISHTQNHHPDIELAYNTVKMRYSTHSVRGLSEADFLCARQVNALLA